MQSKTIVPLTDDVYRREERRISQFTVGIGFLVGVPVGWFYGWRWGLGILIGAVLAWLNFRWLKQGLDALTEASIEQANREKASVPVMAYLKAAFRYGLIGLMVYVIFRYLNVPVLSMVIGLCALGAATMVVSVQSISRASD